MASALRIGGGFGIACLLAGFFDQRGDQLARFGLGGDRALQLGLRFGQPRHQALHHAGRGGLRMEPKAFRWI